LQGEQKNHSEERERENMWDRDSYSSDIALLRIAVEQFRLCTVAALENFLLY
jgi:hypothetical protein